MHKLAGQVAYFTAEAASTTRAIVSGDGYWLPAVQGLATGGSTYALNATTSKVTVQGRKEVAARVAALLNLAPMQLRSEEHTSALQSLMRISYAVFCLQKK